MSMVSFNGSGNGIAHQAQKEAKEGFALWRRKLRTAKKNESEEEIEFEEQVLDALEKLAKTCEDLIKRTGKLEQKISDFDKVVTEYRVAEIDMLREEMQRRTLYMEKVFEEMLEKNFTHAGNGRAAKSSMYNKDGKLAGPAGKIP